MTFDEDFNRSLWLYSNVTLACNRRDASMGCDHCYLNNRQNPTIRTMSEDTISRLANVYRAHVEKYGESRLNKFTIFGGEPLVCLDGLKKTVLKFRRVSTRLSMRIFTNGDLLTPEIITWAAERNVGINLSVNDNSLGTVEKRLSLIRKYGQLGLMVAVLTRQNLYRLRDIVNLAYDFKTMIRVVYSFLGGDSELLEDYKVILPATIRWFIDSGRVFNPEGFFSFWTLKNKDKFYSYCGERLFTIDPDGSVLPCQSIDVKAGNIWDKDFDFLKLRPSLVWSSDGVADCEECEYKLVCGGGCPLRKMKYYGTTKTVSPTCEIDKLVAPLLLEMKKEWEERQ